MQKSGQVKSDKIPTIHHPPSPKFLPSFPPSSCIYPPYPNKRKSKILYPLKGSEEEGSEEEEEDTNFYSFLSSSRGELTNYLLLTAYCLILTASIPTYLHTYIPDQQNSWSYLVPVHSLPYLHAYIHTHTYIYTSLPPFHHSKYIVYL